MKRTRRTRTIWRLAAATAGGALLLSGCNLVGSDPGSGGDDDATGDEAEEVTLTAAIVPDPPGASEFYRAQFDLFEEANPGITVDVIENPADQQLNAIELMFQQGEAPDVFRAQGTEALQRFYDRGWLAPLNDLETDEFIARFPEGSMDPGVSGLHIDGDLVSLPLVWGDWGPTNVLMYNADILAENGYDTPPETWGEFEEMARTITANGGGSVFGTAPNNSTGAGISMMAPTGTPPSTTAGINLTTGEPIYTDPNLVTLVEMWRGLQADGSLMPGWESWDGSRAFSEFAAGRLAMYPSGTWHVAEVRKLSPEIAMELAPIPVPDAGRVAYHPRSAGHQPIWSMSAESEHPEQALKLMDFLASVDFYAAYYEEFGSFTASMQAWEDAARENPDQAGILDVSEETLRTAPNPQLAAAGGEEFWAAAGANPDLRWLDIALESVVNNVDYLPLAEARTEGMEAMLAEYEADNPDLRDAITFSDWDPLTDYAPAE